MFFGMLWKANEVLLPDSDTFPFNYLAAVMRVASMI